MGNYEKMLMDTMNRNQKDEEDLEQYQDICKCTMEVENVR